MINLLSGGNPIGFLGVGVLFIYWLWLDHQRAKKLSKRLENSCKSILWYD